MNRRLILVLVFALGFGAGGVVVPRLLPQPAVAQDAEVTLVATDDDASWFVGDPLMEFRIYRGGVAATAEDEAYRDILDQTNPIRAFTEAVNRSKE